MIRIFFIGFSAKEFRLVKNYLLQTFSFIPLTVEPKVNNITGNYLIFVNPHKPLQSLPENAVKKQRIYFLPPDKSKEEIFKIITKKVRSLLVKDFATVKHLFLKNIEELRLFMENSSDAVCIVTPDGTVLYNTPNNKKLFGINEDENIGNDIFHWIHPEDLPAVKKKWQEMLQHPGQTIRHRFRCQHGDGTWMEIEGKGKMLVTDFWYPLCLISFRNIPEIVKTENILQELLFSLESGIILADPSDTIVYINPYALQWLDSRTSRKKPQTLQAPELAFLNYSLYKNIPKHSWETRIIKHSRFHHLHITKNSALKNFPGYTLITLTDITPQKEKEKILRYVYENIISFSGQNFFNKLTSYLCQEFNMDYCLIGSYKKESHSVQTLSFYSRKEKYLDNIEYSLKNTPCESTLTTQDILIEEDDVQKKYPKDQWLKKLNARSYVGLPIYNTDNTKIGLVVLIGQKPLDNEIMIEKQLLLFILSYRIANELIQYFQQQKIQQSYLLNESILKALYQGILLIDKNQRVLIHNFSIQSFASLLPPKNIFEQMLKTRKIPAYPSAFNKLFRPSFQRILNGSSKESFEVIFKNRQGESEFFSFDLLPLPHDQFLLICHHLTEWKHLWKTKTEIEVQFSHIFQNIDDLFFILSHDGKILLASPSAKKLGYDNISLQGKSFFQLFHLSPAQSFLKQLKKEKKLTLQHRFTHHHKHPQYFFSSLQGVFNDKKELIKIYVLSQNITQKYEEELHIRKAIIETQEKEKKALAMEIHDNLGQMLLTLKLQTDLLLKRMKKEENIADLLSLKALIKDTIELARNITYALHPNEIKMGGLLSLFKGLIQKLSISHINFHLNIKESLEIKDAEVKTHLYRIVQEFVNNSIKHSQCKNITIAIRTHRGHWLVDLKDDGKGFDLQKARKKHTMGIANIFNRIHLLNGTYHLKTEPGKGTELSFQFKS